MDIDSCINEYGEFHIYIYIYVACVELYFDGIVKDFVLSGMHECTCKYGLHKLLCLGYCWYL